MPTRIINGELVNVPEGSTAPSSSSSASFAPVSRATGGVWTIIEVATLFVRTIFSPLAAQDAMQNRGRTQYSAQNERIAAQRAAGDRRRKNVAGVKDVGLEFPLRVLALHGSSSNIAVMKRQIANLNLTVPLEVFYAQGSFEVPPASEKMKKKFGGNFYGWQENNDHRIGVEDLVNEMITTLNDCGPFDGIIGFSRGAWIACYLTYRLIHDDEFCVRLKHAPWKFIVALCPSPPRHIPAGTEVDFPSIFVLGENDPFRENGEEMGSIFPEAEKIYHQGKHTVPRDGDFVAVDEFLKALTSES